jgi:hypothetical protein
MPLRPDKPVTFSQGRNGQVYLTQGYGLRPEVWRPGDANFQSAGLDPPTAAPTASIASTPTYYVARLDIVDRGQGYLNPPVVQIVKTDGSPGDPPTQGTTPSNSTLPPSFSPFGTRNASAVCRIQSGSISETEVIDGGRNYPDTNVTVTLTPDGTNTPCSDPVTADCYREGVLQAILRPTLRGKYLLYTRYVDNRVPESAGGPLYSSLSPSLEVDTGNAASVINWTLTQPADTGLTLEVWRCSSNQALVLYKVGEFNAGDFTGGTAVLRDDLNDSELLDPQRDGFSALPITLPNGEINANRFTPPPEDYAVGVLFQDRYWMGVHAPGDGYTGQPQPNTLRFSEQDEPESMPDVNELVIQQNLRSADFITALVPYAGAMLVMQSRHCHRLTYVVQPVIDAGINLFAYRGCINQRCWDIYEGRVYSMDTAGVYSIDPQGKLDDLSIGIDDIFQSQIDWTKRDWFLVRSEREINVLRVSVAFKGDNGEFPTRQLVYALDYKAWWIEEHPTRLSAGCDVRSPGGQTRLLYGSPEGTIYKLNSGTADIGTDSIDSVAVTNPGRGYTKPPAITVAGGSCAVIEAAIDVNGSITGLLVKHPGTGYPGGDLVIEPPPTGGTQATGTYTVASGAMPVSYSMKTGNMEFTTDTQEPRDDSAQNRQVSVVYRPTEGSTVLNLQTFYNGADYPRSNVVRRDRGVGFVNSDVVPAATLDMAATKEQLGESHGVARALFYGRTLDDIDGNDRHVALSLCGQQQDGKVVIHTVDVHGVNQAGGS